jgi:membrane protease YdiL (CAAX protease family)
MWLVGMLGVVVVATLVVPILLSGRPLPLPVWVLSTISVVQGGVLLALTVWAGVAFAPKLGLRAPGFEAFASATPVMAALRPQLAPGLLGGLAGGVFLALLSYASPAELLAVAETFSVPLLARVLYGGITEELLLRWGVMSLVLWLLWRFVHRAQSLPPASLVWIAIISTALLFGVGHLPAASAVVGDLTFRVVAYVIGGNALFGLLAGWLFWRFGLESAMLAHALAHVVAYLAAAV